ncbi:ABC transporter substrate-binding protein [Collinsella sp. AGMB00827]|uniref:ABC transporter substrate-binding protein n=1 Tax=Collinsella ureilytica TaxID=2869515 RepID=A0ABS7MIH5_9ACTN|nr:ABC transporter substrate-binding protein [Collinsella urealyticum]MBY4797171.1 ABC transporter substrate-binding protein [Collinsella urealyticum]
MQDRTISRRSALALAGAGIVAGLGLVGCGGASAPSGSGTSSSTYKIGILQLTEHPALDAANKGFIRALDASGISYTADQQNAQNDQSACQTIAAKFAGDGDDLIFAIATPAAQAAAGATSEIPIVGTAITDFVEAGLAEASDRPGKNVTGTSDLSPVAEQLDLMKKVLPEVKLVGILYSTAEANSAVQVKAAEDELERLGIASKRFGVSSSNEIQSMMEAAVGEVDAVYAPTDNTVSSSMAQVAQIARDAKVPVICGEEAQVDAGGLFSLSVSYEELGYKAGEMAVKILTGKAKPAELPIEHMAADELKVVSNKETADALNVDLSALKA